MTSSGAFMVNFEQISQMILVLPLSILNKWLRSGMLLLQLNLIWILNLDVWLVVMYFSLSWFKWVTIIKTLILIREFELFQ